MSQCPVDEMCEPVREHHDFLFGKDGVRDKLSDCITKKSAWTVFLSCMVLIIVIGGFILDLWAASREINRVIPKIELRIDNHEFRLAANEAQVKLFKQQQDAQTKLLKSIAKKLGVE